MSYDPASDVIDVTVTSECLRQPVRDATTAAKILQSDNERAKIFARSPQIPAMEYEERGVTWKFERRNK